MKKKLIAIAALLLVAAITGVTWAQVTGSSTIGISTAGVAGAFVDVKTAYDAGFSNLKHKQNPSWSPIENASGNISAGDLYYIDAAGYTGDIRVMLYLTNLPELGADYSYMLQQINVYAKTASENAVATTAVTSETLATGSTAGEEEEQTVTGTLIYHPVVAASETFTATASGGGHPAVTVNSFNDQTGAYSVTFTVPATETANLTVAYTYYNEALTVAGTPPQATLAHKPIKAESETLKDVGASSATTLVRGTNYTINYSTGVVTFTASPSGTIVASYTYYVYGAWAQAKLADSSTIGTVYLSLQNGFVSFILAGTAYYDITIDDGVFYCIDTTDDSTHDLAPSYYLDVRQS